MTDVTKIDAFVQSSPHPAWLATSRGECLYVNAALGRLTGLKSDQINLVDWRSFVLEEDRAAASASWQRALASGTPYRTTVRLRGFDGVPATVELIAFGHTLNDGTELWLFTGLHVHGTTQQYPRLEAQLQATLNVIPAYTWYALPSGGLTFVNGRTADYLGLPKDHPLRFGIDTGAEWDAHISLLHPDDREESRRIWSACVRTGSPSESNIRVRNAEGGYRWFLTQVEPLRASDGTLLYWIGVNLDIDDRKRAEEFVRQSERELRTIVETIPAHIHSARPDGYLDFFNSRWLEYVGLPLEDLLGWKWTAAVHPADVEGLVEAWRRVLATGEELAYEARVRRADGEFRWMFHRKVPHRDERGDIVKWFGSSIDIEEIKRTEAKLQKSEAYLSEAQRLSHTGSFGWKPGTGEHVWTDETYRIFEYDCATKPMLDMVVQRIHPQDRAFFQQIIYRASQTGTGFEHEYRLLLPDGRIKHVQAVAHATQNASGSYEFVGAVTDITEIRKAEEALRRSEHYLAEAQTLTHTGSWAWQVAGRDALHLSDEWYRIYGFDPIQGMPKWEERLRRVHPEDRDLWQGTIEQAIRERSGYEVEFRILLPDGTLKWIHTIAHQVLNTEGEVDRFVGSSMDVTERKRAEEKIRRNERELRTMLEIIPAHVGVTQPDGTVDFVSQSWLDYSGQTREEAMGWGWTRAIHPEDLDRELANWRAALASAEPVELEGRFRNADGIYRWFLIHNIPLRDEDGNVIKWYGILFDINALKETESALQTREHELLGIIETIPSMVWSASPAGEVTYVNQKVLEYCGVTFEEYTNRKWVGFLHPDDREESAKVFSRAIETGETYNITYRVRRADGEYRWQQTRAEPLRGPHGKIIQWYGFSIDIDEGKRAEDHLRDTRIKLAKASRLATVAELSGSITHELNQPLTSILANAQAAKRWLNAGPSNVVEANSSIERIIRGARAADETMQHIRALFKQESFDKKDVNIPDILREVVRIVQEDPKKRDIPIECHFEESLPTVHVDQIQIQQVFINLILNAIEALEGRQVAPLVVLRALTNSDGMLIQVIDNGPGVDDADRIFDAFVTTKEKGMGVGLAVSRSTVEAHGGRLWAENNKTGGATFNVTLLLSHSNPTTA
jgi:PAS domain S-box-containing protein